MTNVSRYTCDYNSEHKVETEGPMPAEWLQVMMAVGTSGLFDSIDCAHAWYDDRVGA